MRDRTAVPAAGACRPRAASLALRGLAIAAVAALASCGDDRSATFSPAGAETIPYAAGVFLPSATFAARCAAPRTGIDPATGRPYPDVQGSTLHENHWLRSWTNELYLWYREVPDIDPALSSTTLGYFNLLKTSATTPSGRPVDRFHFAYPTAFWEAFSQAGVEPGYGAQWVIVAATPPRSVFVAYAEPNSPASTAPASLARGAQVLAVDGVDLVYAVDRASVDVLNAGLFPAAAGETHVFSIRDPGAASPRSVTMTSANVTSAPVQNVRTLAVSDGVIGYLLFNDHVATSEPALIDAFAQLQAQNVSDLVLDIRYNGGGYLDIASEVAYMIAGPARTAGMAFELTMFNDKHPTRHPLTGAPIEPLPFHSASQGFFSPPGQPLPTLDLARVFVLTGSSTCSASESIINGLRGVGVQVIQIGSKTCGKPYGFHPADNCGTTYFSIQFKGVNQLGFGDYPEGFAPANSTGGAGVSVPGCEVADDLAHALGDPAEARLAAALGYRMNQLCPAPSGLSRQPLSTRAAANGDGVVPKPVRLENRIFRARQRPQ